MDKVNKVEELDTDSVIVVLQKCEMNEFEEFIREKKLDGKKLLEVTEGIIKMWKPKANAKRFILFIEDLKHNPEKYITANCPHEIEAEVNTKQPTEIQYQTVKVKNAKEDITASGNRSIDDIIEGVVPVKSFLYKNQPEFVQKIVTSYVPMDSGMPKKRKKFFRLSSYEYPHFDLRLRFSKLENYSDRGYYSIKTNNKLYLQNKYSKVNVKSKNKPVNIESDFVSEEHDYEDLCYNEIEEKIEINEDTPKLSQQNVKPCFVKMQELFQSFKFPFFRRNDTSDKGKNTNPPEDKEGNIYENNDSSADMYDSVNVNKKIRNNLGDDVTLAVEEYLEPIQVNKDYCDVNYEEKEESILSYIMSIFENRFKLRRETTEANQSDESDPDVKDTCENVPQNGGRKLRNMADRPLPVPVENESYYMNIDRSEAENMLKGHPDGTYILRPSSQPTHIYTLTVSCNKAVHNIGVRRRSDGRLALGFARRGERTFATVTSLLRHHRKRRLLLVSAGGVIGATTLNETPQYYQTPCGVPLVEETHSLQENTT